jgi:hypothetical protein
MKIRCGLQFTSSDHGYVREDDLKAALQRSKHIRPCGLHHGWVVKSWCPRCQYALEVIMEEGDPPLRKQKRRTAPTVRLGADSAQSAPPARNTLADQLGIGK